MATVPSMKPLYSAQSAAIMGRRTAFHGIAASQIFGTACTLFEQGQFDDVLAQVTQGEVDAGLMAWDNTLAGPIPGNRQRLFNSGLYAVAEAYLPIRLYCMALPGSSLEQIHTVRSHPMALQESKRFLSGLAAESVAWGDTASAAASVAESSDLHLAAIASRQAAQQFHLSILAEGVEDHSNNVTRFVVVAKRLPPALTPETVLGGIPWQDKAADSAKATKSLAKCGLLVRQHGAEPDGKALEPGSTWHFEASLDRAATWPQVQAKTFAVFPGINFYGAFPNGSFLSE